MITYPFAGEAMGVLVVITTRVFKRRDIIDPWGDKVGSSIKVFSQSSMRETLRIITSGKGYKEWTSLSVKIQLYPLD